MIKPMTCPNCNGRKTFLDYVQWSDGLGGVDVTCDMCDGVGEVEGDPVTLAKELHQARKTGGAAQHTLNEVTTHLALYLHFLNPKTQNVSIDPPLRGATGPAPDARVWLKRLEEHAKLAPRFTHEQYRDYCTVKSTGERRFNPSFLAGCSVWARKFYTEG